jgi:hypothetical protein
MTTNKGKKLKLLKNDIDKLILKGLIVGIYEVKMKAKNQTLPRGYLQSIVKKHSGHHKWLTITLVKNHLRLFLKKQVKLSARPTNLPTPVTTTESSSSNVVVVVNDLPPPPPPYASRNPGGRPPGTTLENKRKLTNALTATLNSICKKYEEEKLVVSSQNNNKRMKKGRLDDLIQEERAAHNLPPDVFPIDKKRIQRRCQRGNAFVELGATKGGCISPLIAIEPYFVMKIKNT